MGTGSPPQLMVITGDSRDGGGAGPGFTEVVVSSSCGSCSNNGYVPIILELRTKTKRLGIECEQCDQVCPHAHLSFCCYSS